MKRLLFLLLAFVSFSAGAQELALSTIQHTRPHWSLPSVGNSSNNGCCASFVLPLNDLGSGAVNTAPAFSLGSGTATFTRATTADTTLSTLCWASVASGTARSFYLPSGTYGGYLADGARTNTLLQSTSLSTTWTNTSAAPTANAIGADCQSNTGWTLTDSSAVTAANVSQAPANLTAAAYTYSVFIQQTTGATTFPVLRAITGTVTALSTINTNTCTPTAWTAYTGDTMLTGISVYGVQVGNYCWEWLTFTGTAASYTFYIYPAATATSNQSTGIIDVTQQGSAVVWNPQVELGASASTPIPTTTLAVQRNLDSLSFPTANNFYTTAGATYAEVSGGVSAASQVISTSGGGGQPIEILSGTLRAYDGTADRILSAGLTLPFTSITKLATAWGGSVLTGAVNGVTATATFDGDMNLGATTYIGVLSTGGAPWFGTIKNVISWPVTLSAPYLSSKTTDATDFLSDPMWRFAANDPIYRKVSNQ